MAEIVNMIALSPTMDEGTLAEWRKSEGDSVAEGEVIADVETDKATMEMESWYEGTLLKILADENSSVEVGDPIAIVGEEGEEIGDLLEQIEAGERSEAAPADSDESSDSAQPEATTEPSEATDTQEGTEASPTRTEEAGSKKTDGRLRASPLARRVAADEGIEIAHVDGSGPAGRIIKRDVEAFLKEAPPTPEAEPTAEGVEEEGEAIPLSQMRKTIAERLQASWQSTPHFALTVDIDMAEAMSYRSTINQQLEDSDRDVKISVNDLIVKASAEALASRPEMNVSYQGDHLLQFDDVHIGIAVAVEDGLVTPVVRNADEISLSAISSQSKDLAAKARDKKLMPEDYAGGTFTVSNLGMYGIDHFMAVINPPQAAILACGQVEKVPVVEEGELTVGTRMKVTLSCDHRAVDGAMGAEFLNEVKRLLENPVLLTI